MKREYDANTALAATVAAVEAMYQAAAREDVRRLERSGAYGVVGYAAYNAARVSERQLRLGSGCSRTLPAEGCE